MLTTFECDGHPLLRSFSAISRFFLQAGRPPPPFQSLCKRREGTIYDREKAAFPFLPSGEINDLEGDLPNLLLLSEQSVQSSVASVHRQMALHASFSSTGLSAQGLQVLIRHSVGSRNDSAGLSWAAPAQGQKGRSMKF